jgi:site-specific recombinase XerC
MAQTALMVANNLSHNVPSLLAAAKTSLTDLATLYLATEVAGQSQATLDAKRRDLDRFLAFYHQLCRHDRPEEWFVSVTKAFLKQLRGQRLAQASLVRIYATVRHFARWVHRKFPDLFPLGCPTDGVKPPAEPTADWKGLTRLGELRLLNAAQTLRVRPGPGTKQGLRNHALLAVLLGSGLRISEVLQLDRDQYTGKGFAHVQIKGGQLRDVVPVQRDARAVLEEWLEQRGDAPGPLFPTRRGHRLSRREAALIMQRLAGQANANRPEQEHIQVAQFIGVCSSVYAFAEIGLSASQRPMLRA